MALDATLRNIHRIGGGYIENLRLSAQEIAMEIPGFSVLEAETAEEAAIQIIDAFPGATRLLEKAEIVGSTSIGLIRTAGFDVMADPTRKFPNHQRIIHRAGIAGFTEEGLSRLSAAFYNTERS